MSDRPAIIVFAHGSSVESANQAVRDASTEMAHQGGFDVVETAFLEDAHPNLAEAVASVVERGVNRILVIPYFLTLGIHLQRDLPRIIAGIKSIHKGVEIEVTAPLDGHPGLISALLGRADAATRG